MRIGSLFSGIGGLELGLEWAGVGHTVWQVEQSPFCRAVLAKHWPDAQRFDDVRTVGAHNLAPVDVICGGFPCTDVSLLGKRAGIREGTRSGLWLEFARIVRELSPYLVVVENTRGLDTLGLAEVLADLYSLGYRGERLRISAVGVGADHERKRTFVVAHAGRERVGGDRAAGEGAEAGRGGDDHLRRIPPNDGWERWTVDRPRVLGKLDGLPFGVDRNKALGNAVVPQVAAVVGARLLELLHPASPRQEVSPSPAPTQPQLEMFQ